MVRPTDEQEQAVERFRTRRPLKIAAFAGTGKTSTLTFMARSRRSSGLYLAFNKAIATEAKEKFPRTVDCRTTHSLAYRSVVSSYSSSNKLTKTLYALQFAAIARYPPRSFGQRLRLTGVQQAHLVLGTIKRFCQSADPIIVDAHVPRYGRLLSASGATLAEVRAWSVAQAAALWQRMKDRNDDLPMGHDGYLKLWALSGPKLHADYVLLDEAQDTNQVVLGVLQRQNNQIVYVGDRHQQIYEWRGAVNAMEQVAGCDETSLTQSFRFGEPIANAASRVLGTLGETQRLRGNPEVQSSIVDALTPTRAVLARTNANVIVEVLDAVRAGRKPCIVGGTAELTRLLSDVYELKDEKPASSPEFFGFTNWREVVAFADSEEGESIKSFVQLVEQHGENKLWPAVKNAHDDENSADVVLSTAHKAKGREWDSVRLAPDFASSRTNADQADNEAEVRLFYVAMTRAKKLLAVDPTLLTRFTTEVRTSRAADSRGGALRTVDADPAPQKKAGLWKRLLGE
jgi:superfamily I DNA/RNA helicase